MVRALRMKKEPIVKLSWAKEIAYAKALRQEQGTTVVAAVWGRGRMGGHRTNKTQNLMWFDIPSV